jgi:Putative homoserine kinase type II (protein kinase fold)
MITSKELLDIAAGSYGFDTSTLRKISESTNLIYMFNKNERMYILRLSKRPPKELEQVAAELDWLYFLATHGISVSLPLETGAGELVFGIEINAEYWIVCAFEFASGRFWDKNDPAWWNEEIFTAWGVAMGRLHAITKSYKPSTASRRTEFSGREALFDNIKSCPPVNETAKKLVPELVALPRDADSFGLIHYDLHPWNFYIDKSDNNYKINLFDFDDCLYGYYALDIGIALYHGLWWGRHSDAGYDFSASMIRSFLHGYLKENPLNDFWLSKIPDFMRFRQICKFSWFYNPNEVDDHQRERIRNIERGVLFSDLTLEPKLFTNI